MRLRAFGLHSCSSYVPPKLNQYRLAGPSIQGAYSSPRRYYLPEARWDCHTQKVIAPIKRAACTQSLTGLPLSRIAEAIMATAQAVAQRMSARIRFAGELVVSCLLLFSGICFVQRRANAACQFQRIIVGPEVHEEQPRRLRQHVTVQGGNRDAVFVERLYDGVHFTRSKHEVAGDSCAALAGRLKVHRRC